MRVFEERRMQGGRERQGISSRTRSLSRLNPPYYVPLSPPTPVGCWSTRSAAAGTVCSSPSSRQRQHLLSHSLGSPRAPRPARHYGPRRRPTTGSLFPLRHCRRRHRRGAPSSLWGPMWWWALTGSAQRYGGCVTSGSRPSGKKPTQRRPPPPPHSTRPPPPPLSAPPPQPLPPLPHPPLSQPQLPPEPLQPLQPCTPPCSTLPPCGTLAFPSSSG